MERQETGPSDIEAAFVTAVNILAKKHDCRIIECDYEKRLIEIEGPPEKQLKVALALDKFLAQWEVKEPAYDWKRIDDNIRIN
ncbi:MAG: hypothetical protein KAV87_30625 [Desulfobacteraceae bacterium]|nr:hypothetical protein [Desulfobacteraceae bacterium]